MHHAKGPDGTPVRAFRAPGGGVVVPFGTPTVERYCMLSESLMACPMKKNFGSSVVRIERM